MSRVTVDEHGLIAILRVDGEPVLLAEFSAKWRINHMICYVERQPRLASDIYEEMAQMCDHSLDSFIDRLEELIAFYD